MPVRVDSSYAFFMSPALRFVNDTVRFAFSGMYSISILRRPVDVLLRLLGCFTVLVPGAVSSSSSPSSPSSCPSHSSSPAGRFCPVCTGDPCAEPDATGSAVWARALAGDPLRGDMRRRTGLPKRGLCTRIGFNFTRPRPPRQQTRQTWASGTSGAQRGAWGSPDDSVAQSRAG